MNAPTNFAYRWNLLLFQGYTALHFAVIHDHEGIISMLVDDYGKSKKIQVLNGLTD